jgi:hypothetical protein
MRSHLIRALSAIALIAAPADADVDIPTSVPCGELVTNSVTNRIYARCGGDLVEIDGDTHAQRSLPLARPIVGVDPVGNRVIASNAGGITVVDVPSWTSIPYAIAGAVALDPASGSAWIAQAAAGVVTHLDLATGATTPFPLGASSTNAQVTIDPVNDLVYVALSPLKRIVELDPATGGTRFADVGPPVISIAGGLAIDPLRRELFLSAGAALEFASGPAIAIVDTETMTVTPPSSVGDENPLLPGTDPGNDRVWIGYGQLSSCAGVRAERLSVPGLLGFVTGCLSSSGQWAVNPATSRAYVGYYDEAPAPVGAGIAEIDVDPPSAQANTALPNSQSGTPAVVLSTGRVYVAHHSFIGGVLVAIREHDEAEVVPVPLAVAITLDGVGPDGTTTVHFSAASGWPTPLPVQQIFYQVDSIHGAWTPATTAGPEADATLTLAPGTHVVHAFAVDGQEATISRIQQINPVTGPVASLEVVIAPPACSNGDDDDGDGATDYPADPGCQTASGAKEDPKCDDGVDNDGDGGTDWDGGGQGLAADAQCLAKPWKDREIPAGGCGLGAEIALALALARTARRRFAR